MAEEQKPQDDNLEPTPDVDGEAQPIEPTPVEPMSSAGADLEPEPDVDGDAEKTFAEVLAEEEEALGERIPIMMADEDETELETTSYDLAEEEAQADKLEAQADNAIEAGAAELLEESAEVAQSAPVQAVNNAIAGVVSAVDNAASHVTDVTHEDHYSDTFTVPITGQEMTLPGGIYTFIFLVLGALTIFEVAVAEIFPENFVTISILVIASLLKAVLVVAFYMHLRTDNPLFRVVLILPVLIVLISVLYLLGVPVGEGLGYQ